MEPFSITKYSVWLLIVSICLHSYPSTSCLEDEKLALLQLKSYFLSVENKTGQNYFTNHISSELSSWDSNGERNCCLWKRVKCNNSVQRVIDLDLSSLLYSNVYYYSDIAKRSPLNVSLFQPFGELISLDLSSNYFNGLVGDEGNKTLSLVSLETLYYEKNYLPLQELGHLVGSLRSLKELFLNDNGLDGNFPGQELAHLKKLQVLDLSDNYINGSLPGEEIAHLKKLQVLDLSGNNINGSLPGEGICRLRNLEELKLHNNSLSGSLPKCLWNLTSLRVLHLSDNSFSGNLPAFINLPSLQWLSISNNNFQGGFSLSYAMNHSALEVLLLSNNALQVEVDQDSSSSSTSKLVGLGLSHCNLNGQSKSFLKFLSFQSNLEYLELSSNGLSGVFPDRLLQNNSNLHYLSLRNNSLFGSLKLPNHSNLSSLSHLDISRNSLQGKVPCHIGVVLSSVKVLKMSSNSFEGRIPASIGNMTQLYALDLSFNHFSGEVSNRLFSGQSKQLEFLLLSNNSLQGEIIPNNMSLSLMALYLDSNDFVGSLNEWPLDSTFMLTLLDLSNNRFTGEFPSWLGNFGRLETLSLASNEFHGDIPSQLFCNIRGVEFLDLSENRFTGGVPSCDESSVFRYLHLHGNRFTGVIPEGLTRLTSLQTLDLRNNRLSGGIPQWIDKLSQDLVIILLGGNQLEGELPIQLCHLQHVNIMDLSNNRISGAIPSCFQNMSFGALNVDDTSFGGKAGGKDILLWHNDANMDMIEDRDERSIDIDREEEVEFVAKSRYGSYKGNILRIMSALDLSYNKLTGEIPLGLGNLGMIYALNLSHNRLSGPIPITFSKLKSIESLDLSSNNLSGTIPFELVGLNFLEIFNVSYNNLSGQVPETGGQFGTFDESNYLGNPLLCGSRLPRSCKINVTSVVPTENSNSSEQGDSGFDMEVFLWSFGVSAVVIFLAINAVLAINPFWRRAWFAFLDVKLLWWFLH